MASRISVSETGSTNVTVSANIPPSRRPCQLSASRHRPGHAAARPAFPQPHQSPSPQPDSPSRPGISACPSRDASPSRTAPASVLCAKPSPFSASGAVRRCSLRLEFSKRLGRHTARHGNARPRQQRFAFRLGQQLPSRAPSTGPGRPPAFTPAGVCAALIAASAVSSPISVATPCRAAQPHAPHQNSPAKTPPEMPAFRSLLPAETIASSAG